MSDRMTRPNDDPWDALLQRRPSVTIRCDSPWHGRRPWTVVTYLALTTAPTLPRAGEAGQVALWLPLALPSAALRAEHARRRAGRPTPDTPPARKAAAALDELNRVHDVDGWIGQHSDKPDPDARFRRNALIANARPDAPGTPYPLQHIALDCERCAGRFVAGKGQTLPMLNVTRGRLFTLLGWCWAAGETDTTLRALLALNSRLPQDAAHGSTGRG